MIRALTLGERVAGVLRSAEATLSGNKSRDESDAITSRSFPAASVPSTRLPVRSRAM